MEVACGVMYSTFRLRSFFAVYMSAHFHCNVPHPPLPSVNLNTHLTRRPRSTNEDLPAPVELWFAVSSQRECIPTIEPKECRSYGHINEQEE